MKTRYSAQYVACIQDVDPIDTKYSRVTGTNLIQVIKRAQLLDINGECYSVREERQRETCRTDGAWCWETIATFDPYSI